MNAREHDDDPLDPEVEPHLPEACAAARADLAAELYGELEPAGAARLGAHLAGCGPCRAARAAMSGAARLLDAWELPEAATAPLVDARPARPRRAAARGAAWAAAAAALVALVALTAGASVRVERGALTLTLRAPWRSASAPAAQAEPRGVDRGALVALERRLDARCAELEEALRRADERRLAWSADERADRLALAAAVDGALVEQRRALAGWLDEFSAGAARAELRTRDALVELASYVASDAP